MTRRRADDPRRRAERRRKADPIGPGHGACAGRPGLVEFVLEQVERPLRRTGLAARPRPHLGAGAHDPVPELGRYERREGLRGPAGGLSARAVRRGNVRHVRRGPHRGPVETVLVSDPAAAVPVATERANRPGWGGSGLVAGRRARLDGRGDWRPSTSSSTVIRPGGLAPQKAPRIQASLQRLREAHGNHSLEFLGDMEPLAARAWLTGIDGVGVKTASVVLLMSFGMPLMPVDRHVDRVSKRIGLHAAQGHAPRRPTTATWRCSSRSSATRCTSGSSPTVADTATPCGRSATSAPSRPAAATWTAARRRPRRAAVHGAAVPAPHGAAALSARWRPPTLTTRTARTAVARSTVRRSPIAAYSHAVARRPSGRREDDDEGARRSRRPRVERRAGPRRGLPGRVMSSPGAVDSRAARPRRPRRSRPR